MILLSLSFFASAILCGAGLYILSSLLPSGFLAARFNSRSNHSVAARQIGGLALIPAIVLSLVLFGTHLGLDSRMMLCLSGASLLLWIIGALDDRFELSVKTRFAAQFIAACLILYGLGADFRLFPKLLPHSVEIIILVIALIASINITNFMDGLDLMTVGGIGTPLLGVAILAALMMTDAGSGAIAAITAGGLLGFAFFNRPPARIFLGDSGSLPIGLLAGTVFLLLAKNTHIVVALILPLYYILDTSTTLILRAVKGENIFKAHSQHAYQLARRSGWSVQKIIVHVVLLNLLLISGAMIIIRCEHIFVQIAGLFIALVVVLLLLLDFRGLIRTL